MNRICKLLILSALFLTFSIHAQTLPRIVSLSPNLTEIIIVLDGQTSLVGRSSACDYIESAKSIPIAGDMGAPNLEKIILLKANVVVASALRNPSDARIIENLGIKFYLLESESFKDYFSSVEKLGKILDKEKEAEKEMERVKSALSELREKNKSIPLSNRPKVFWEIWNNPLITIGHQSFLNEFIELAGGRSITEDVNRNYFEISKESVMIADPDVIIAPGLSPKSVKDMKSGIGWSSMSAIKNNRIYTDFDLNLVNVFGPRMITTIQLIHNLLYKE